MRKSYTLELGEPNMLLLALLFKNLRVGAELFKYREFQLFILKYSKNAGLL